jgi:hypothetical protein
MVSIVLGFAIGYGVPMCMLRWALKSLRRRPAGVRVPGRRAALTGEAVAGIPVRRETGVV